MAGLILLLARCSEDFAEYLFARGIYRVYRRTIAAVTGLLPFSLGEVALYLLLPLAAFLLLRWVVHMGREERWYVLKRGLLRLFSVLGVLFFLFVLGCGGNYYRKTYAELAGLEIQPSTDEELFDLCLILTSRANAAREKLADYEDEAGVFALPYSFDILSSNAKAAIEDLSGEITVLSGNYAKPKPVLASRQMSRFGITGVFFPFTVEANVNVDVPDYTIGAAMCHELSHMAGFMREDEANYLAYLACTYSDDEVLRYSGVMSALSYAGNALYRAAPELYRLVCENYSDAVIRDLVANDVYWGQFADTTANELGEKVNDAYLKANHQSTGTQSYGAMVDLLLAEYRLKNRSN